MVEKMSQKMAGVYVGLRWYTERMLYSALLLRVDRLLEAARYTVFIGGRPPELRRTDVID
jgi:hypothetical protein